MLNCAGPAPLTRAIEAIEAFKPDSYDRSRRTDFLASGVGRPGGPKTPLPSREARCSTLIALGKLAAAGAEAAGTGLYVLGEYLYNGNGLGFGEGKAAALLPFFERTNNLAAPFRVTSSNRYGGSPVISRSKHLAGFQTRFYFDTIAAF